MSPDPSRTATSPMTLRMLMSPLPSVRSTPATVSMVRSPELPSTRSAMLSGTVTSKSSLALLKMPLLSGVSASMRNSEPLRDTVSLVSLRMSRLDAQATPVARTSPAPRRPLMWRYPARPMMTMRLTPAAGAATLRFSLNEQSPKMSAEAVAAMQRVTVRRASEVSVRIRASYANSDRGFRSSPAIAQQNANVEC